MLAACVSLGCVEFPECFVVIIEGEIYLQACPSLEREQPSSSPFLYLSPLRLESIAITLFCASSFVLSLKLYHLRGISLPNEASVRTRERHFGNKVECNHTLEGLPYLNPWDAGFSCEAQN